jgi:hypothetical protein
MDIHGSGPYPYGQRPDGESGSIHPVDALGMMKDKAMLYAQIALMLVLKGDGFGSLS